MQRLFYDYSMKIHYSVPVSSCNFTIKCIPKANDRQKPVRMQIACNPAVPYEISEDAFGNRLLYGYVGTPHDTFHFHISGIIQIDQILYEEYADDDRIMIYRHPYGLNKPGACIREYFKQFQPDAAQPYDTCLAIMHRLHRDMTYTKGCTDIRTDAETAFSIKSGVCQDYAHIFLSLLHLAGIPARYVTGFIEGEGASHAWVEALCHDRWIGFDPTNDILVADSHIRLGEGRDASDCLLNRGIMRGGGEQTQEISVAVERL